MKKTLIIVLSVLISISSAGCKKKADKKTDSITDKAVLSENSISSNEVHKNAASAMSDESKTVSNTSEANIETTKQNDEIQNETEAENINENSSSESSIENNPKSEEVQVEDHTELAYSLYQSGIDMYSKVIVHPPYKLDYDNYDVNGFVLINDSSVASINDITALYCTVFSEPDSYIYEKYSESNGNVYYNDASRGTNAFYTNTDLDYVSGDESKMTFNAISHYSDPETGEAKDDKIAPFTVILIDGNYKILEFDYPK